MRLVKLNVSVALISFCSFAWSSDLSPQVAEYCENAYPELSAKEMCYREIVYQFKQCLAAGGEETQCDIDLLDDYVDCDERSE